MVYVCTTKRLGPAANTSSFSLAVKMPLELLSPVSAIVKFFAEDVAVSAKFRVMGSVEVARIGVGCGSPKNTEVVPVGVTMGSVERKYSVTDPKLATWLLTGILLNV